MRPSPAGAAPAFSAFWVITALWLLVFTAGSQVMVIAPILPRIAEQLGTAEALLGTLVTVYAFMSGLVAVLAGPVSDRIGRRRILLWGTALEAVALALHGFADTFGELLAMRALAGASGGVLAGAAVAYVGDAFPPHRRGLANGWVMSGMAAGQILGIPAGALLAERFGFRAPFLAFAVLMALTWVLVWFKVPQPAVQRTTRLTLGTGFTAYRELLRRREVRVAALVLGLMFGGTALFVTYLPTFLEVGRGMTPAAVAGIFLAGGVASAVAGPLAGRLSDTVGRKRVVAGSSLIVAVMMAAYPFASVAVWAVYAMFFGVMIGFSGRGSPFQVLIAELSGPEQRGSLMAVTVAVGQMAFGIGGALAGVIYTAFGSPASGYAASGLLAAASAVLVSILVMWGVPETGRQRGRRAVAAPLHPAQSAALARAAAEG
jgi:predicted MFS family arabinose efflux permease